MARYTGAVCRLCRREGQKLFLKGDRCYSGKCAFERRPFAPGQHGQGRKKLSEYGLQHREKQKGRRFYGVLEGQFRKYFEMASNQKGMAGENLLRILESRLDNVVYRAGFAMSRPEARQLVRHNHFMVNGKKANIPSILLKDGDVLTLKDKSRQRDKFKFVLEATGARPTPDWLSVDQANVQCTISRLPNREDVDLDVAEHLIVELYSK